MGWSAIHEREVRSNQSRLKSRRGWAGVDKANTTRLAFMLWLLAVPAWAQNTRDAIKLGDATFTATLRTRL